METNVNECETFRNEVKTDPFVDQNHISKTPFFLYKWYLSHHFNQNGSQISLFESLFGFDFFELLVKKTPRPLSTYSKNSDFVRGLNIDDSFLSL